MFDGKVLLREDSLIFEGNILLREDFLIFGGKVFIEGGFINIWGQGLIEGRFIIYISEPSASPLVEQWTELTFEIYTGSTFLRQKCHI